MSNSRLRRSVYQSLENYAYQASVDKAQANLEASCKNSLDFVQRLDLMQTLSVHSGCVNTVNWNAQGTLMVSGSDDNHLVITELKTGRVVVKSKTQHKRHIFSARFMPHSQDQAIISCSGEGLVLHTEFLPTEEGKTVSVFDCHKFGSTFDVMPLVDSPRSFLSCGEDATVRCFDLNQTSNCSERVCQKHIYISAPCAVTAMDVAPLKPHLMAIGCSDSIIRIYDRRMLSLGGSGGYASSTVPVKAYPIPMEYTRRHYRPTCVKFKKDESELLVSYSMEQLYLFDLQHPGYEDASLLRSGCYTPKMRRDDDPEPQMPRLRFRGDWSDTGPNSLALAEQGLNRPNVGQARPPLEPGVLSRLSDEIFRMLNSPTRQARNTAAAAPSAPSSSSSSRRSTWQSAMLRTMRESERSNPSPLQPESLDLCCEKEAASATDDKHSDDTESEYPLRSFNYVKMSFSGHRNSRTMVKGACFWGDDFIMSGSDCGHIFIWQRSTGKVVKTLLADNRVVNRVQPHPTLPYLLSSGIDYNVKLWAPLASQPNFNEEESKALIKSNEIMLVETRDTITVPAQIMIRILASLHQYRRLMNNAGSTETGNVSEPVEDDDDNDDNNNNNNNNNSNQHAEVV